MICVSPMAPFRDPARNFPPLSTRITARIQCSGTAKRLDASVTKPAKGLAGEAAACWFVKDDRSACAALLDSIDNAEIATMQAIAPRDRKAAIVLTAVQGKALSRRPRGRPGPTLRAMAVTDLVGTEEWCCIRSNSGMTSFSGRTVTITP
jgi:hypothetical protein